MKTVTQQVASGTLAARLQVSPFPPEIVLLSRTFVRAQEARHRADYDLRVTFTRTEATQLISDIRAAISGWNQVRRRIPSKLFLTALVASDRSHAP